MTYVIPLTEPDSLRIGDTWTWIKTLPDYPSTLFTQTYYFKKSDQNFSIVCTPIGIDHQATVTAATNANYRPGKYRWTSRVVETATGNAYTVFEGETEVLRDPSAVGNWDFRTTAQKIVAELTELSRRRAGGRHQVSIDGINMVFDNQADIITALSYWGAVVENEQNADRIAKGLGSKRNIRIRM
jgi:hypothetical protein